MTASTDTTDRALLRQTTDERLLREFATRTVQVSDFGTAEARRTFGALGASRRRAEASAQWELLEAEILRRMGGAR